MHMSYLKKISSLEEIASAQVAINLCQENDFKELALHLGKPTYGTFLHWTSFSPFVSDPKKLSTLAKIKEAERKGDMRLYDNLVTSLYSIGLSQWAVEEWDASIDEQCRKLTEGLPSCLKPGINAWINRIALECLSYCRRQEILFGLSRYFLMDILTQGDWMNSGRLHEEKIAKRLIKDERLTILQQYRIACVYCLHVHIPRLWKLLTEEEKHSISGYDDPCCSQECNQLVLLWSYYMDRCRDEKVTGRKNYLWIYAIKQAVCDGNRKAVMSCWEKLDENKRQHIVITMALKSVLKWQNIKIPWFLSNGWREKLLCDEMPLFVSVDCLNLPSYYSELVCFFLSEMNEVQQLKFFKKAFQNRYYESVLECFLDWPHQEHFLPTMSRLWGIVPKDKYGQCLLTLTSKCTGSYDWRLSTTSLKKETRYYDYRSLLWMLWEETPDDYKQHMFQYKKFNNGETKKNECIMFFPGLLQISLFQKNDEALVKRIFRDIPQEERVAMMCSEARLKICLILIQKEMWCFLDWLLEQCLLKEKIPNFKKQFIQSDCGRSLCLREFEENHGKLVEDLINWSFELDAEKMQFKCELVDKNYCFDTVMSLLSEEKFIEMECMVNFCLSTDEMRKQFKLYFVKQTCCDLLKDCAWEQMDKILAWTFDTDDEIRDFKRDLLSYAEEIKMHYRLVFLERYWEGVEGFYKWFCLSPEEIKNIKKRTVFSAEVIQDVGRALYKNIYGLVLSLNRCIIDEEMVISLKRRVELQFEQVLEDKMRKKRLDVLMCELVESFSKKEVHIKASKGSFVEREKKSVEMEDKSIARKKAKISIAMCDTALLAMTAPQTCPLKSHHPHQGDHH